MLSHVRTDQPRIMRALEGWLAGVYAAPDLAQAAAAAEKLGARGLFVTPQGHVVDRVSITFWAEDSEDAGIVSRAAQIRELAAKEAELRAQIEELDEKLIAAKAKAADFEVQYRAKEAFASEIRNLTHALEVEHSALEAAITGLELAEEGRVFENGEGLVKENVEKTIETFGKVGKDGMKETDIEILHLMIGE